MITSQKTTSMSDHAVVLGIQVLDEHEGHAAVGPHGVEEGAERVQPAGLGAQPDDRHVERQPGRCRRFGT